MKNKQTKTIVKSLKTSKEFDFFVHNPLTKYEGMYVAILDNKVVASGFSAKKVWEKAVKKNPKKLPTLAKLPKKEILVMVWN